MKPLPKAALFCANLPEQLRDDDLKLQLNQLFSKYGKVHHVKLNRDRQNRLGAFIQFQLSTQADLALNKSNKIYLKDRLLRVERARVNRSLRISNTSLDATAIESLFGRYGDIEFFLIGPSIGTSPEESAQDGECVVRYKYRDDCMSAWFTNRQSTLFKLCWAHERHPFNRNTHAISLTDKRSFPSLTPDQPSVEGDMTQSHAQSTQTHTQSAENSLDKSMGALDLATAASKDVAPSVFLSTRSESFPEMREHSQTHQPQQQSHDSPNTPTRFIPSTPQLSPDMNEANHSMETAYPLTPPSQSLYEVRPPRKSFGRGGGSFESRENRRGGFRRNNNTHNRPPKPNNPKRHYLNMNYLDGGANAGAGASVGGYYHPGYTATGQHLNQGYYPQPTAPAFIPYPTPINFGQPVMAYPYPMAHAQSKTGDNSPASADKMMGGLGVGVGVGHPGIAQGMRGGYMALPPDMHAMAPLRATGFMTTNAGLVPLYSPQDLERWNEGLAGANTAPLKDDTGKDEQGGATGASATALSAPAPLTLQQYPFLQQPQPQHLVNVGLGLDTGGGGVGIAAATKNAGGVHPPRFFGISPPGHHTHTQHSGYEDWEGAGANAGVNTGTSGQSQTQPQQSSHTSLGATYYDQQSSQHHQQQHQGLAPPPPGFTTGPPGHTPAMRGY